MQQQEEELTLKGLFVPFTTTKAIIWTIVLGFTVYFNSLFNGFVWDDEVYILNNVLTHIFSLPIAFGTNSFNEGGQYRPITVLYFSLLYNLFGNAPFFYHLLQLLLHITCTILLFLFFRKFISKGIAFFITLVFLLHPINIESVSFIASTDSQIFLLLGFIALFIVTKKAITTIDLILIYAFTLLSILTKETGVLFLPLIILYSFLFARKHFLKLFGVGALSFFSYIGIRFAIWKVDFATRPLASVAALPFLDRLLNIPAIVFYYIQTFFFPDKLAVNQDWVITHLSLSNFYLPLLGEMILLGVLGFLGLFIYKNQKQHLKPYLFFSVWFFLGYALLVQIFPLDQTVADRWFYFPLAGLMGILGIILQVIIPKVKQYKIVLALLAGIILFALSVRTVVRNMDWADTITLFSHDIQISDNFDTENHIGLEYIYQKQYDKALPYLQKSVLQKPYETNLQNLATDYTLLGDIQNAKKYYELALQAKDYKTLNGHIHDIHTYHGYANILVFYGDPQKAEYFLNYALKDYPDAASLWEFLALAKIKLQDRNGALEAAQKAAELDPTSDGAFIYTHYLNNQPFTLNLDEKNFQF